MFKGAPLLEMKQDRPVDIACFKVDGNVAQQKRQQVVEVCDLASKSQPREPSKHRFVIGREAGHVIDNQIRQL